MTRRNLQNVVMWFVFSILLQLQSVSRVAAQTTDSLGYPDPRYSTTQSLTAFSCTGGARNCPNGGQYASAGGNLTLTIVEMRNLPDLDSFGLAGLETDAYVEALIGDNVRTSGVVWNSLNPKWPPCTEAGCAGEDDLVRDLNFGFRPAGTEIIVRVWDKDSGFEFGDDLVAQVTLNAIYCSAFSALKQKLPSNDTSTWALAEQPMCVEELWIPLTESGDCTDAKTSAPCMRIRMTAVPFQMRTEEVFVSGALVNGGMGGYFPDVVDAEDRAALVAQKELQEHWAPREAEQCRQRMQEFLARRLRRESEGILTEEEDSKPGYDEGLVNAKEALLEIESGYSCVPGEYGRSLQFVDREFPPDTTSLTGCSHESEVAPQWKVSSAINIASGLFDGGTDPDDVRVGRLDDAWLLSALSIMAASGGVDDGKVDELIDRLFVTKQTSLTGAYALRLYQNCQWETVVVDDYFPVLYESAGDEAELSVSAGAAFAHSRDFEELWVPLVEKAFAKYYGGYAALERGYVHHALRVLSGCECEEVFLAPAARGALKKTLWQQLKLFRKNQFLLGAASLPSEHADPALRASGLVFDACYVIYDVRDVDGAQLLKLRNPPGDHEEWKGDWSDSSRLWTRRLRKRLGVRKGEDTGEDNTFWMSFDDFCHAFRALYVCRYYDPDKWTVKTLDTRFSREDATSSGLPTRHNPGCTGLDNNPHFSLRVSRPTEVIVTVTQVDSRGMAPVAVLPIAVYIVAHQDQKDRARRVTALNQDNVTVHSGVPARNREVRIQCELAARTYTLLVAAYVSGMEGPFRLHVQSNYPVELQQIWPAAWKTGNGTMTPVPHGTLVERMAEKMKHTVTESAAGTKIMAKTHELADKIAAGAAIVDNVMRDEESILEEQLAKQQQEEADEAEKKETRLTGKKKKKTDPDAPQSNPWIEQWDEGAGKPFYFNKQTGMSSWEKPDDF